MFETRLGQPRHEERLAALHAEGADVEGVEAVDVLLDADGAEDGGLVNVLGELEARWHTVVSRQGWNEAGVFDPCRSIWIAFCCSRLRAAIGQGLMQVSSENGRHPPEAGQGCRAR
eukprot:558418-Pyramimonas_sp.AAC.1